jgi:hypothetical protein
MCLCLMRQRTNDEGAGFSALCHTTLSRLDPRAEPTWTYLRRVVG